MLKPAILFKEELEEKFAEELYTEKYFYYMGYAYGFGLPNIRTQDEYFQWAIVVPPDDEVIGYLAYHVDPSADSVDKFGLFSFNEGNLIVAKDTFIKMEELIKTHHRVEWRVVDGNHAKQGYDAFCNKHNGNRVCLHDVVKDIHGKYHDEYIYEVINGSKDVTKQENLLEYAEGDNKS